MIEREELPRMAVPMILITGGKGGVGKTTLAANLGVELAREGHRVLLVDLDLGLANLHVTMRLRSERNIEDALAGRYPLRECLSQGPCGVQVLQAGSGTAAMARPDEERRHWILEQLADLSEEFSVVIGDSAAGIGPDVLAFAAVSSHVLLATTPDPAALTDAYGLIKALDTFGEEQAIEVPTPEIVVNLATSLVEAEETASKLKRVCERFLVRSPRMAGWLPRARSIREASARQEPFVTASHECSLEVGCLRRLTRRVGRLLGQVPAEIPA